MAEIHNNQKIIFDSSDWLAGMHPSFTQNYTDTPIPQGGNLATAMSSFNPFRNYGYATPGNALTSVINASVVDRSAIRRIEVAYDTEANVGYAGFGVDGEDQLFRMDAVTGELSSSATWPHTVTPAANSAQCQDVIVYSAMVGGTRAPRVFYSYNNTGSNTFDIGMYALDGSTFDDDFMSTAPANPIVGTSNNYPIPMIVGDDDVLYFGNGNTLYGYDGSVSTDGEIFTALVLPETFRIKTMAKLSQRLVIFGYFEYNINASPDNQTFAQTQAKAYFWDYLSLDPYDSDELEDNYVTCAFQYRKTIGCFTRGRPGTMFQQQKSKIMLYNPGNGDFEVVGFFRNNPPFHGSYEVLGDAVVWNSQGLVYQWGDPNPDGDSKVMSFGVGSGTETGAIRLTSPSLLLFSTGTTTEGGLERFTSNYTTSFFRSCLVSPEFDVGQLGRITAIKMEFAAECSGGRTLNVYVIGNNTPLTQIGSFSTIDATNHIQQFYYDYTNAKLPYFTDIALVLDWVEGDGNDDAPRVKRVEVSYEPTNIKTTLP